MRFFKLLILISFFLPLFNQPFPPSIHAAGTYIECQAELIADPPQVRCETRSPSEVCYPSLVPEQTCQQRCGFPCMQCRPDCTDCGADYCIAQNCNSQRIPCVTPSSTPLPTPTPAFCPVPPNDCIPWAICADDHELYPTYICSNPAYVCCSPDVVPTTTPPNTPTPTHLPFCRYVMRDLCSSTGDGYMSCGTVGMGNAPHICPPGGYGQCCPDESFGPTCAPLDMPGIPCDDHEDCKRDARAGDTRYNDGDVIDYYCQCAIPQGETNPEKYYCINALQLPNDIFCNDDYHNGINSALGCLQFSPPSSFITQILLWAVRLGALITFFSLIYAGFLITTSSGNPKKVAAGKEIIFTTIIGLAIISLSVLLLNFVGVHLLSLNLFGFTSPP
jgi:hypothetical protein